MDISFHSQINEIYVMLGNRFSQYDSTQLNWITVIRQNKINEHLKLLNHDNFKNALQIGYDENIK